MCPGRLDVAGDVFSRCYRQTRVTHPRLVIAKAVQACAEHGLCDGRYQLLFIFLHGTIPPEPGADRKDATRPQDGGTAFEKSFLVLKVFAAFHYPDHVDAFGVGLPLICVADLELNATA